MARQCGVDEELVQQHHRNNNDAGRRQPGDEVSGLITVAQLLQKLPRATGKARTVSHNWNNGHAS
jgi:hypothetical protein